MLRNNSKNSLENSTVIIQKYFRTSSAQEKYTIHQLPDNDRENYKAFLVGNDPIPSPEKLSPYEGNVEKIGFIGTSGLRSLSFACKLGNPNNPPKMVIVDYSRQVCLFWENFKKFTLSQPSKEVFFENIDNFLTENKFLYRDLDGKNFYKYQTEKVKYLNQNPKTFLSALFKKYSYDYARAIIKNTSIICQSWEDDKVLIKIKNIFLKLGITQIFAYPSNICDGLSTLSSINKFLQNIKNLNPVMALHSKGCFDHKFPESMHCFPGNTPINSIKNTLISESECQISKPTTTQNLFTLFKNFEKELEEELIDELIKKLEKNLENKRKKTL